MRHTGASLTCLKGSQTNERKANFYSMLRTAQAKACHARCTAISCCWGGPLLLTLERLNHSSAVEEAVIVRITSVSTKDLIKFIMWQPLSTVGEIKTAKCNVRSLRRTRRVTCIRSMRVSSTFARLLFHNFMAMCEILYIFSACVVLAR